MGLQEYAKKRDFKKTSEPKPKKGAVRGEKSGSLPFCVQKHDASRLHYDFRLELDGVLKSWAVPKGPSLNPADRRLAVEVEDHPIEYASFEGVIPEGQYGGGTVMLWDRGRWTPLDDDPRVALRKGKLSFALDGQKLKGEWTLFRIRGRDDEEARNNWLLVKRDDDTAASKVDILKQDRSVKTGRAMDEIASDQKAVWTSNRGSAQKGSRSGAPRPEQRSTGAARAPREARSSKKTGKKAVAKKSSKASGRIDPAALPDARKDALPRAIAPQLATLVDSAPKGEQWVHEIKFDGYRLLAWKTKRGVELITRTGKDWTDRFRPIADAVARLPVETAIIDGEATILNPAGRTSFQELQQAMKEKKFASLVFFVFDILHCTGYDVTRSPLEARKSLLAQIVPPGETETGLIRFSDHVTGGGDHVHENACRLGLEGVICKRIDAPYVPGRSRDWVKVKCTSRQEFVIVGWTPPEGARKHFGSLLLAAHNELGKLVYTGRVGTGFNNELLSDLSKRMALLGRRESPLDIPAPRSESRDASWIDPKLVAEVEFTEWTDDGRLRHPSFQGLREDKDWTQVRIERPRSIEEITHALGSVSKPRRAPRAERSRSGDVAVHIDGLAQQRENGQVAKRRATSERARAVKTNARATKATTDRTEVGGVSVSSPDRVIDDQSGLTKLDLVKYYEAVADWIMPFLVDRPLSTVRCPTGRAGGCFFQKHVGETFGDPIKAMRVREEDGMADYISIDSKEGLLSLIQFGVIEIHPWGSRRKTIEQPDVITFDLDPGEGVDDAAVKAGAKRVREILVDVGLESFLKTSGGKGLHVVAPLVPEADWDTAKSFCHAVATFMAREEPERYVDTLTKSKRGGKIFVDYLRNGRGATSVAPYSVRARAHLPVSMPIAWESLGRLKSFKEVTIAEAPKLLDRRKDPWAAFFKVKQRLTMSRAKRVNASSSGV
jgi:bifunctional non-homologous end joining protein LigD